MITCAALTTIFLQPISVMALNDLSLMVNAATANIVPGKNVTITLRIDNLIAPINGVQAFITYDESILTLMSITADATAGGVGWTIGIDNSVAGNLDFVAVINGGSTAANHAIATFVFSAQAEGTTEILFRPDQDPIFAKLTLVDNTALFPNRTDSGVGSIVIGAAPTITNIELFYAGSFNDEADLNLPFAASGTLATVDNVSYFVHGITGVRVTFSNVVDFTTLSPKDAINLAWTDLNGTTFSPVTDASVVMSTVETIVNNNSVVSMTLPNNSVQKRWLKITIDDTQISYNGLLLDGELSNNPITFPSGDGQPGGAAIVYSGNMPGDSDRNLLTTLDDVGAIRLQVNPFLSVDMTNSFDVDKDGIVTLDDVSATRLSVNPFIGIPLIAFPTE